MYKLKLDTEVLRTHTSAHQSTFISGGKAAFICTGDVYRRDEIDASHYPVFHQMEGVRIFQDNELPAGDIIMQRLRLTCIVDYDASFESTSSQFCAILTKHAQRVLCRD
jgi:phenylalanyl-tRNA synthetase alpha subunit